MSGGPMPAGRIENVPVKAYLVTSKKWLLHFPCIVRREIGVATQGTMWPVMETKD